MFQRNRCRAESIPPSLLLLTPQLLHNMLFTHRAMAEQLAGLQTPQGPPEATGGKKGSSSTAHRECRERAGNLNQRRGGPSRLSAAGDPDSVPLGEQLRLRVQGSPGQAGTR
ncbi:Hypothetical predicted protein [Marmota monax]|uniref:Uncharacterized protein n=1 Tax=Marmota monax TaxID=9995 RepID=A0A5E4BKQ3_MARMO|nr:Hypothetical predicted protein [Marmota monax]